MLVEYLSFELIYFIALNKLGYIPRLRVNLVVSDIATVAQIKWTPCEISINNVMKT